MSLYNVDEASAYLGLHKETVLRFIREKKLKARKIGRAYKMTTEDINAFVAKASTAKK